MDVTISGRHVDVTDAMRDQARQRVTKLERFCPHLMHAEVTLGIEGDRHTAEVIATVSHKGEVVGKHESHDMYVSIDHATSKVEKQLHRLEEKIKDRRDAHREP